MLVGLGCHPRLDEQGGKLGPNLEGLAILGQVLGRLESAARLIAWICDQKKIDTKDIATHKDVAKGQTSCPGDDFYRYMTSGEFKQWVTRIMSGEEPQIDPGPPLEKGPTVVVGEGLPATQPVTTEK